MNQTESINLFYCEGTSDKVYNISLLEDKGGWVVNFSYGRRGNALQAGTKTKAPLEYNAAKKVYDKLVGEKKSKGYDNEDSNTAVSVKIEDSRDSGIKTQLLNEIDESEVFKYIEDPNYCAQEKDDGRRRLLIKNKKETIGTNRNGLVISANEILLNELIKNTGKSDVTIDTEDMGDYVKVFDLLHLNKDIREKGYKERYQLLEKWLGYENKILRLTYTAWTTEEKTALYLRLKKENAEGIVFKNINAPYTAGKPNSYGPQLKFKFCATASCIVKETSKIKRSVSLQVYEGKNLIDVGKVTVYPNQDIPKPGAIVEVKYLYYFRGGSLFQPVLIGERDDVYEKNCVISQLKLKKEEKEEVEE